MGVVLDRVARRAPSRERRDAAIHVRAPQKARDLIEKAAEVSGKTLTDFVLDSATQQAIDVLLDRRLFLLSPEKFAAFIRVLAKPPPAGPKLKALMKKRPLWDR
jgi:uncharacterized protein (DUF1778 family)